MRKKGSRNRGFWFRKGRGWYVGTEPLLNAEGQHIKDPAEKQAAEQAYCAFRIEKPKPRDTSGYTVWDVCTEYLKEVEAKDAPETLAMRSRLLRDFCAGGEGRRGCGDLLVTDLIGLHVKQWLDAHQWTGTRRMAQQAVRRAYNYGKELGMVPADGRLGFKTERNRCRRAYFDKVLEEALYTHATPALADVIRAMIGTGCRPGEIARLEKRHIEYREGKMLWRFPPTEHKTGKKTQRDRVVPVGAEIASLVDRRLERQQGNRVFLGIHGEPWTPDKLKDAFTYLRGKLTAAGIKLDKDQTLYACRHTYAKRQLGKGISTNVLAAQMGNSPQIAWEHYGRDWDKQADNSDILWSGVD